MSDLREQYIYFESLEADISAIPNCKHALLNISLEEAMWEGLRVVTLVENYYEELIRSDIDIEFLNTISARFGAFSYCASVLDSCVQVEKKDIGRYWELKNEGYSLRKSLLCDFDYVFRNSSPIKRLIIEIRRGCGDLDMIRDLLSLYKIFLDNNAQIQDAHVNAFKLARLNSLYKDLFSIIAQLEINMEKVSDAKLMCIKSWTFLFEAISEIYATGRYVFSKKPKIAEFFCCDNILNTFNPGIREEQVLETAGGNNR